jgi:hypothetical protein
MRVCVLDVAIAVTGGKVMDAYGSGLWIWSFGEEGLGESNSWAITDGLPPRATDDEEERNTQSNH